MKHGKMMTMGCAMALALAPCSVKAASMKVALDACADAMVSELASDHGNPLDYSVSPESSVTSNKLNRRETIHLDARDPATEEVVARADCVVDYRGQVRSLVSVPLDAADAEKRATTSL